MRSTRQGSVIATGVVPPGGDNPTTQQILETMHVLQAEVAASRAEIAASRTNNEELCRTNEELRRDLQQVGECAVDDLLNQVVFKL